MREIMVRFEDTPGSGSQGDAVWGSVVLNGRRDVVAYRFDGWLQLMGLLEDLSQMTDESPEPPGFSPPDQGAVHR
jgi:hypothetical protein